MDATLEKIKQLTALRQRLVETKKKLATPIKEFESAENIVMAKLLSKTIKSSLVAIDKDLKNTEALIIEIVNTMKILNSFIRSLLQLLESVLLLLSIY